MKLLALPKGAQNGVHGPVVCVASKFAENFNILPRTDDQLIFVKLKRKLTYKGYHENQYVNTNKIKNALSYLQQHNRFYEDISVDYGWHNPLSRCEEIQSCAAEDMSEDESPDVVREDIIDESLYDQQQHGMLLHTCLQPVDVAQEVFDQYFNDVFSVALALSEGNNPVRVLQDETNEEKCFPMLFPSGRGTYHEPRSERLTMSKYFNAQSLDADGRFARNLDYIFFTQYLSEVNQVVSDVSIALRKGYDSKHSGNITSDMLTNHDCLQKILKFDDGYKFGKPF